VGGGRGPRLPALVVLVLVLGVAGCASAPQRRQPVLASVPLAEADALLQRWEGRWQEFRGLRAAVDLTVTRKGSVQRAAAVLLLSPTQLRLETVSPLGFPIFVIVLDPERLLVLNLAERRGWSAQPTAQAVGRWLGAPIPPASLIRLLAGYAPPPPDGVAPRAGQERGPHLVFQDGRLTERIWVTPSGEPGRVEVENGRRITATFDRTVNGQVQALTVDVPGESVVIYLRYLSGEHVTPPGDAFQVAVPPGIPIERLD
jgi:hypothetical protein